MNKRDPDYVAELRHYLIGFALALILTLVPFAMVSSGSMPRTTILVIVGICALIQIIVHFRYFLHIDFSQKKREDLQLILFSTLILAIMTGGTMWIVFNLAGRM